MLGYLLGALEPGEDEAVRRQLAENAELEQELALLRQGLAPLAEDGPPIEPPLGLAAKTCNYVALRTSLGRQASASCGWRLPDFMMAAAVLLAVGMLVFPAVSQSRQQAQIFACQDKLRSLGTALLQYSRQHGGHFPQVPVEGDLAAAGVYAPLLQQAGLLSDPSLVVCPASPLAEERQFHVPTLDELHGATPEVLTAARRRMGGSFGYNLGFVSGGKYFGVRNLSRPTFPLMADTPCTLLGGGHRPCGQNVLMEDGHVIFLSGAPVLSDGDDIYHNDQGHVGAGIGPRDAVIGASAASPLILPVSGR